ncbi:MULTISPECIES: protein kinase family protein [Vibrio]|uniref:protein kinase family protein n=1 Tax=Vibrio TaxID=662 RepID=UPI00142822EF|nr:MULTISPECIES: protein kinase family protein [Vibrio]QIR88909.1 protein kinase [Vibrio diabolicus]EJX2556622.1 protein kinase family protein [Vibrio alginolyticus]MBE8570954.1 protein kinase family protein [Vibrio sp. OPT46]MBS9965088.1 protein kinase family protein [Vibrio alginolyticus]MCF7372304.1 protein kinase family protein [Vibrio sp. J2-3(2022)]
MKNNITNELDGYRILVLNKLGAGGFGMVHKVFAYGDESPLTRLCARKVFSPSDNNNNTELKEIAALEERFSLEARIQCELSQKHPQHIAPIIHLELDNNPPSFFMKLAKSNLEDMISSGMDEHQKQKAVFDILNAVKVIHDNNYLHRDIKPANILFYPDFTFKISDFGLVKDLDEDRATLQTDIRIGGMGTGRYLDKEVADNRVPFTVQSDIYSIGQVIYDIYGGRNAPDQIKQVCEKCITYFQEDRYNSIDDLMDAFGKAVTKMECN